MRKMPVPKRIAIGQLYPNHRPKKMPAMMMNTRIALRTVEFTAISLCSGRHPNVGRERFKLKE